MHNQIKNSHAVVVLLGVIVGITLSLIISNMMRINNDAAIIEVTAQTGVTHNADWTNLVGEGGYQREFAGVTMVLVPAGCFRLGNDEGAYHWDGMSYLRGVPDGGEQCIDAPFWIDQTEVTQADFSRLGGQQAEPSYFEGDARPVDCIIWQEAYDFCVARGGVCQLKPNGNMLHADPIT